MKKLGRIFRPQDYGLDYAQAPCAIDMGGFTRVYFTHRHQKHNGPVSVGGYVDFDYNWKIININKGPLIPLGKPGTFDEYGTYPIWVLKNKQNFTMYYAGWTRPFGSVPFTISIGKAKGDGTKFEKLSEGPYLSLTPDEPYLKGSMRAFIFNNKEYLFYMTGTKWIKYKDSYKPVYKIALNGKLLIDGPENECQAGPDVHFKNGLYHMYFSFRDWDKANYQIGLAVSKDLKNWTRIEDVLPLSKKGWDSKMHHYAHYYKGNLIVTGNHYGKYGFGLILL